MVDQSILDGCYNHKKSYVTIKNGLIHVEGNEIKIKKIDYIKGEYIIFLSSGSPYPFFIESLEKFNLKSSNFDIISVNKSLDEMSILSAPMSTNSGQYKKFLFYKEACWQVFFNIMQKI